MSIVRKLLLFWSLVEVMTAGVSAAPAMLSFQSAVSQPASLSIKEFQAHGGPNSITGGPDGNIWFTENRASKIGRITPSGQVTEYPTPTQNTGPVGITAGPDGNVWFAEVLVNKIGRITRSGQVTEYPVPTPNSAPIGITAGPDGNVWFTELSGNQIGRITRSGQVTEFQAHGAPDGITAGPDGNMWFTERNGNKIGRITRSGQVTEYPVPTPNSAPIGITAGPDGNMWFIEQAAVSKIGRITPSGQVTEYLTPTQNCGLTAITAGPDGNVWFTEQLRNKIGRITRSGQVTEHLTPTQPSGPVGITAGPDGNIWFTENIVNKIGRANPTSTRPGPSHPSFTLNYIRTLNAQGQPQTNFRGGAVVQVKVVWIVRNLRGITPYQISRVYQRPKGRNWSQTGLSSQVDSGTAAQGLNFRTFQLFAPKSYPAYRIIVRIHMLSRWSRPKYAVIHVN